MLFRQIRMITGDCGKRNDYIIFVNCKGGKAHRDALSDLVREGFWIGDTHYVTSERSASMVRTSILSFVDESISEELRRRVTMDIHLETTVLSKWYAYRGLMLSSCHCLEGWTPRIIIVPDLYRVIPNQTIKYVYDKHMTYEKDGKVLPWVQKDIATGVRDIEINAADGCGIHHPDITDQVRGMLDAKSDPTSILWRAPFIKGVTHEMDYISFFQERGVTEIVDIWGVRHDVSPSSLPAIIMCESMYKGFKYFKRNGDVSDWEHYWEVFHKYNHCIGVAKWNFSLDEEPLYTRGNYQILQDLDLPYEDFATLARYSISWVSRILTGDPVYLYSFLGLFADQHKSFDLRMEALVKNRMMIHESGVRQYIISLISKTIDDMKCGKLYLKACFKFEAPDLIMLMEHIGGLPLHGCLESDEFFSFNKQGKFNGYYLVERNPHICRSEHCKLKAVNNELTDKYCSHLVNVAMLNSKSITAQRLNGSDFDGDLVLVIDEPMMMAGVDPDVPITIDVEDKVTALEEADTPENQVKVALRGMNSLIGETSNCATAYINKTPKTIEAKLRYDSYINLLSVINGKAIDSAKTGVVYNIPRYIAKYGRPLPYFMKYASPYYASMKDLSKSLSNMNRLCMEIESWQRSIRWNKPFSKFSATGTMQNFEYHIDTEDNMNQPAESQHFDYKIMIDDTIPVDKNKLEQIRAIFLQYNQESSALTKEFRAGLLKATNKKSRSESYVIDIDWQTFYNSYRLRCFDICPNICELANYAVIICYEYYPKRSKGFLWHIVGEGIIANLKQVEEYLPIRDDAGDYEYLGRRYRMEKIMFD